jgi:SAM-dependent methyltransferase/peptidoglycan/xylan/chitin deacetylase (PgdA/CDA1 family)
MSGGGLPVLTYHAFDTIASPISTDPGWFAETMARLRAEGYRTIDLQEWIDRGRPDLEKRFALTFDDGLASILNITDILLRYAFEATIFVVSGRAGRDNAWPSQPAGILRARLLDWDELADLSRHGIRIGSHTCTHPVLDRLGDDCLETELRGSRDEIEDRLGLPCRLLAYPYGIASSRIRQVAAGLYTAAWGTGDGMARGHQPLHQLRRIDGCDLRSGSRLRAFWGGRIEGELAVRRVVRGWRRLRLTWSAAIAPPPGRVFPAPFEGLCRAAALRPGVPAGSGRQNHNLPKLRKWRSNLESVVFSRIRIESRGLGAAARRCPVSGAGNTLPTELLDRDASPFREVLPRIAGIADLRCTGDRYLNLHEERAKAQRLAEIAQRTDLETLASAYYAMTPDVGARDRSRFLTHIHGAEARGEALVSLVLPSGPVLEIGSGTGGLLVAAARKKLEIVGSDIALRWLVLARRRLCDRGLDVPLVATDGVRLPWEGGTFATVVADSVVEHLEDPLPALIEWRRVTRPGGRLLLWSPNRYSLAPDPHVGLWGLGLLPPQWVPGYISARGRGRWSLQLRGAIEIARLATAAGWDQVRVEAPALPRALGPTPHVRVGLRAYETCRRHRYGRAVLRQIGPLWQLTAVNGAGS